MGNFTYQIVTGTGEAVDATPDVTIIAAQGTSKTLRIQKIIISVTVAAVGGGGEVALEDGVGGTRFIEADADAVRSFMVDFGEEGYPLTSNTLLNLTVDNAVTTQATARATVVAKVVG